MKARALGELEKAYNDSQKHQFTIEEWKSDEWENIKDVTRYGKNTGIPVAYLK